MKIETLAIGCGCGVQVLLLPLDRSDDVSANCDACGMRWDVDFILEPDGVMGVLVTPVPVLLTPVPAPKPNRAERRAMDRCRPDDR